MKYYSALKRREVWPKAETWANPKDAALSEVSQSHKDKYYSNPLTGGP